jgi:hypothetical protein
LREILARLGRHHFNLLHGLIEHVKVNGKSAQAVAGDGCKGGSALKPHHTPRRTHEH